MHDLPVMLNVRHRRCVVVGGGLVALRRAAALREAGATVTVIAPQLEPSILGLDVLVENRRYRTGDLQGAFIVVVATDDPDTNRKIADDARELGVLTNRADDPTQGDITVPAHAHHGPITIAVHTSGISAAAAATIRDQLSNALDSDWQQLLEIVAPYRQTIQQRFTDARQRVDRLMKLTDEHTMNLLKTQGPDAVKRHCQQLASPTLMPTQSSPPQASEST